MNNNFNQVLAQALRREENDNHLTTEERQNFVNEFVLRNPEFVLTGDVDEDFVNALGL